jgi:hypothetical protein
MKRGETMRRKLVKSEKSLALKKAQRTIRRKSCGCGRRRRNNNDHQ